MFGIIFIVFSALAAIINYELDTTMYSAAAPATFIGLTVVTAMLPYIVLAVLSFTVAVITSKTTAKSAVEKEPETQAKQEVDFQETPTT